jgi:HAD superfamily hydrolase (TIGR01509 family)
MSAIFFDMDGTLVDSEPLWLQAEVEIMAQVGCVWTAQDQIDCLGGPRAKTEKMMQDKCGNLKPDGYFGEQLDKLMVKKLESDLELIPNALELLNECRNSGLKIGLVTASGSQLMNSVLKRLPRELFDVVVSGDDVKNSKPAPDPYLLAAEQIGVEINHCLVIEDSITGVTSGLSSGAQVIGIPHLVNLPIHENLRVVRSLSDLSLSKILDWYPFLKNATV